MPHVHVYAAMNSMSTKKLLELCKRLDKHTCQLMAFSGLMFLLTSEEEWHHEILIETLGQERVVEALNTMDIHEVEGIECDDPTQN